jgi:hypothetical protein
VLDHPAVTALCHKHGIDPRTDPWTLLYEQFERPTVFERDPVRVKVELIVEEEKAVFVLEEDGTVASVRTS